MMAALAGAAAAYGQALAAMTPKTRAEYFLRQAKREREERLEASSEVRLAREMITAHGLDEDHGGMLLSFARELVVRREN